MISGVGSIAATIANGDWRFIMRCLECGAEPVGAQACFRCGAPVGLQHPMAGTEEAADTDDWVAPLPTDDLDWLPGHQAGPGPQVFPGQQATRGSSRRKVLIGVGAAVVAMAALITVTGVIHASSSAANRPTSDQLRPGDCLTGSNMDLPGSDPWPGHVTRVACTQPHVAEVYFASDIWPQSLAYPGEDELISQVNARCENEFAAYDGISLSQSKFDYATISPLDSSVWASGSRRLVCVAYIQSSSGPSGGALVSYSFKGRKI